MSVTLIVAVTLALAIRIYAETCAVYIKDSAYGRQVFMVIYVLLLILALC